MQSYSMRAHATYRYTQQTLFRGGAGGGGGGWQVRTKRGGVGVWVCGEAGVCRVCHRCIMSVGGSLLVLSCVCCCDVHLFFHAHVYKNVRD